MTYAGFWKRFAAAIIDKLITGAFVGIFAAIGGWFYGFGPYRYDTFLVEDSLFVTGVIGPVICFLAIDWLYYALLESSNLQATWGKLALGVIVTDLEGNRITFARASGRHFAKMISKMTAYIGYVLAAFTERKQALHDLIAGCLLLNREGSEEG